jgi:hypothetical protein
MKIFIATLFFILSNIILSNKLNISKQDENLIQLVNLLKKYSNRENENKINDKEVDSLSNSNKLKNILFKQEIIFDRHKLNRLPNRKLAFEVDVKDIKKVDDVDLNKLVKNYTQTQVKYNLINNFESDIILKTNEILRVFNNEINKNNYHDDQHLKNKKVYLDLIVTSNSSYTLGMILIFIGFCLSILALFISILMSK